MSTVLSWTELNNLNHGRQYLGGQGTYTAAIAFGGEEPGLTGKTELYNGSNWTETGDLNTARYTLGSGTLSYTEGFCVGGWLLPGVSPAVEAFDGTSWTETTEMNTARNGPFLSGDSSNAICSGGSTEPPVVANAEIWNGSSWTETSEINTARYNGGSAGTYTGALIFGSNPPASGVAYGFTMEVTLNGSNAITWPGTVKWNADTAPTLTDGKTQLFMFVTNNGGTRWRGSALVYYVN